jgi:glycosyltransferase involved in cell wall biosynthesis
MWPITGGCHTFLGCKGYQHSCANCPHFSKGLIKWWPAFQLRLKHKLYKKKENLHFLGISKWCTQVIRKSAVAQANFIHTISNPIDTDCFADKDKTVTRRLLGLPLNKILIGFGARNINNPLKGTKQLFSALDQLKKEGVDFEIVTFGNGKLFDCDYNVHNLGATADNEKLSLIYNSLDIFVSPSLSETFGNTVAEAMACGTPVVGFKIGGVMDIIDHKINGYMAEPGIDGDLANGIRFLLSQSAGELRLECRKKIVTNFSRKIIFNQHIDLFNQILCI